MSVSAAIDELKVKRDILLNNADVRNREAAEHFNEVTRILAKAADLEDAIKILESHARMGRLNQALVEQADEVLDKEYDRILNNTSWIDLCKKGFHWFTEPVAVYEITDDGFKRTSSPAFASH